MGEERRIDERVDELELRLGALEARLARLEAAGPAAGQAMAAADGDTVASPQDELRPRAVAAEAPSSNAVLHRVAVASFALVGALLLRTLTRQHLVNAELGTALGLVYCGLLLFGPALLERSRGPWGHARMLQISGTLLVPVILLEMVGRHGAMSLSFAALAIGAVAASTTLLSWLSSSGALAATLVALLAGVAALGAQPEAALPRALVLVELCAASLWLAHVRGWFALRAFVLLPASALLSAAVIYSARRPEFSGFVPALAAAQLLILAFALGSNALRSSKLGRLERVLAPLLLLWTYLLMIFIAPDVAPPAAAALAGLLLLAAALLPRDRSWSAGATSSSLLLGALLAAASFPLVERSGLALALAALVAQFLGRRRAVAGGTALAQVLALAAAGSCVARGGLLGVPAVGSHSAIWLGLGLALVVLLLASYGVALGAGEERRARAQSLALVPTLGAAALISYGSLQLAATMISRDAQFIGAARGVIIGALAVATLLFGRTRQLALVSYLGIVGIVVLLLKVVTLDMVRLQGGYVVAAVLTLGVAATATSIVLKRTPSPTEQRAADDVSAEDAQ